MKQKRIFEYGLRLESIRVVKVEIKAKKENQGRMDKNQISAEFPNGLIRS